MSAPRQAPSVPRDASQLVGALRGLRRERAELAVAERVLARLVLGNGEPQRTRHRLSALLLPATAGAVALSAGAWFLSGGAPLPRSSAGRSAEVEATAPFEPHAIVVGPETLLARGTGPVRTYALGEAVPLGIPLQPEPGRGAALRVGHRVEVRLDPGAEIAVDPPAPDFDGISLAMGRIALDVQPALRPVRVRWANSGVEAWTDRASFGALASSGDRWAVAVAVGEVRIPGQPELRIPAPGVGGGKGSRGELRDIPVTLDVAVETARAGNKWIVSGLCDVFAHVEVNERPVALDDAGAFRTEIEDGPVRSLRVTALDATGRRVERALVLAAAREPSEHEPSLPPTPHGKSPPVRSAKSPRNSADAPATPPVSPPPAVAPKPLRVGPPNW